MKLHCHVEKDKIKITNSLKLGEEGLLEETRLPANIALVKNNEEVGANIDADLHS
ncbi:hypothetical protein KHA80_22005 [Anaerobacillus sp. HL2]|nr:hypothetical protein KHA80_22005 [Anaerobacillus sp. HL2]